MNWFCCTEDKQLRSYYSEAIADAAPHANIVYMRATLLNLDAVNTAEQTWTGLLDVQFVIAADAKLVDKAFKEYNFVDDTHVVKSAFKGIVWPEIQNIQEVITEERWARLLRDQDGIQLFPAKGKSAYRLHHKLRAVFYQRFDYFQNFPFDSQLLKVRMSMQQTCNEWRYATAEECNDVFITQLTDAKFYEHLAERQLKSCTNTVGLDARLAAAMSEWNVRVVMGARTSLSRKSASRVNLQYSHATLQIPVQRRSWHFVWNYMFPFFVTTSMILFAFCTRIDSVDGRIAHAAGVLLAAIQAKQTSSSFVPPQGGFSLLDKFCFAGIFFLMACASIAITVGLWDWWLLHAVASWAALPYIDSIPLIDSMAAAVRNGYECMCVSLDCNTATQPGAHCPLTCPDIREPIDNFLGALLALAWGAIVLLFVLYSLWIANTENFFMEQIWGGNLLPKGGYVEDTADMEIYCEPPCQFKRLAESRSLTLRYVERLSSVKPLLSSLRVRALQCCFRRWFSLAPAPVPPVVPARLRSPPPFLMKLATNQDDPVLKDATEPQPSVEVQTAAHGSVLETTSALDLQSAAPLPSGSQLQPHGGDGGFAPGISPLHGGTSDAESDKDLYPEIATKSRAIHRDRSRTPRAAPRKKGGLPVGID